MARELTGILVIRAFGNEKLEERFEAANKDITKKHAVCSAHYGNNASSYEPADERHNPFNYLGRR